MRIRKRQVPLPLSSLLPVPLSDLCSNRSPTSAARYFHGQDIDGGSSASLLHLPLIQRDVTSKKEEKALDDDYGDGDDVDVKSCTVASGSNNGNPQGESDSSTQVVEKNDNVVSLRKRRRGYTSFEEQEEDDEEEEEEANKRKKKKGMKKSSAVLEEGSRCSRVNGRGWRCCQQTLYGYSLCEHHLGKGRVRSTNKSSGGRGGGGQKKEVKTKKKRVKLGTVKARSISSLLGQTSGVADVESEISAPAYDK